MADARSERQPSDAARDELLHSSAVFITELEQLLEMERRKRALDSSDPDRIPLAREIEELTVGLVSRSRYQTRLLQLEAQEWRFEERGFEEEPARAPLAVIQDWRAAERRLYEARLALERASDETDRLREEHHRSRRSSGSSG
jgi:hypothetical protein